MPADIERTPYQNTSFNGFAAAALGAFFLVSSEAHFSLQGASFPSRTPLSSKDAQPVEQNPLRIPLAVLESAICLGGLAVGVTNRYLARAYLKSQQEKNT